MIEHRSLLELSLSIEKSLSCVIEQLVIWHYILVQGGHDYFRFVEGTCIIACVLSFSVLFLIIRCTKTPNSLRLWTTSDSEPGNSSSERKRKKVFENTIQPPLLVVFLTFIYEQALRLVWYELKIDGSTNQDQLQRWLVSLWENPRQYKSIFGFYKPGGIFYEGNTHPSYKTHY